MNIISNLRNWLYEPRIKGVPVDEISLLSIHKEILHKKFMLRSAYETTYKEMMRLCDRFLALDGIEVELGSGAGFFKSMRHGLVTSDIRKDQHIDLELDAQNMMFGNSTVRCIYAINVFHHLSNPELFLTNLCRVLVPGGGCILVEPHNGFLSAFLHRYIHTDETFLPEAKSWLSNDIKGPLSGANQAMAYIVFSRDIERFNMLYGDTLEIYYQGYVLNTLRYLISGGLNFRQLLPTLLEPAFRLIEYASRPFARHFSLHQVIVIRKRER
jgi:SAM-dependent methyltransferase